jgi:hypothetical protein
MLRRSWDILSPDGGLLLAQLPKELKVNGLDDWKNWAEKKNKCKIIIDPVGWTRKGVKNPFDSTPVIEIYPLFKLQRLTFIKM